MEIDRVLVEGLPHVTGVSQRTCTGKGRGKVRVVVVVGGMRSGRAVTYWLARGKHLGEGERGVSQPRFEESKREREMKTAFTPRDDAKTAHIGSAGPTKESNAPGGETTAQGKRPLASPLRAPLRAAAAEGGGERSRAAPRCLWGAQLARGLRAMERKTRLCLFATPGLSFSPSFSLSLSLSLSFRLLTNGVA